MLLTLFTFQFSDSGSLADAVASVTLLPNKLPLCVSQFILNTGMLIAPVNIRQSAAEARRSS